MQTEVNLARREWSGEDGFKILVQRFVEASHKLTRSFGGQQPRPDYKKELRALDDLSEKITLSSSHYLESPRISGIVENVRRLCEILKWMSNNWSTPAE